MATPSVPATSSVSSQFTYSNASYFPVPFHLQQSLAAQYAAPYAAAPAVPIAPAAVYPSPASVAGVYSLPQCQQAQQLFQRDAQTITPEALEGVKAAIANSEIDHKSETKKKAVPRKAAGQTWEDPTLAEWPENDYRLFCGDLGNEGQSVNLKVVRDKRTGKTKGYGFVSFASPADLAAALKEMNGIESGKGRCRSPAQ